MGWVIMETKNYIGMRFVSAMVRKLRDGEEEAQRLTSHVQSASDQEVKDHLTSYELNIQGGNDTSVGSVVLA